MRRFDSAACVSLLGGCLIACAGIAGCSTGAVDETQGASLAIGEGSGYEAEDESTSWTQPDTVDDTSSTQPDENSEIYIDEIDERKACSTEVPEPGWLTTHCSGGADKDYKDYEVNCKGDCKSKTAEGKYKCTSTDEALFKPKAKCAAW